MSRKFMMAAMAAGLLSAGAAQAGTISLTGGTCGISIPGGSAINNFLLDADYVSYFGSNELDGCINQSLRATVDSYVTAAYYGAEAGYINRFRYNGSTIFTHNGGTNMAATPNTPKATSNLGIVTGGTLLPFVFTVNNNAASVANGGGDLFRSVFYYLDPNSPNSVWLWLDDSGAGPDDNHDDMLVKLTLRAVPEPTTLSLLGLGLLAAGLAGRRRRA